MPASDNFWRNESPLFSSASKSAAAVRSAASVCSSVMRASVSSAAARALDTPFELWRERPGRPLKRRARARGQELPANFTDPRIGLGDAGAQGDDVPSSRIDVAAVAIALRLGRGNAVGALPGQGFVALFERFQRIGLMLAGASVGCFVGAPIGHLAGHQAGQLTGRLADACCGIAEFLLEDLERMGIDHGLAGVDFVGAKEREELADEHLLPLPDAGLTGVPGRRRSDGGGRHDRRLFLEPAPVDDAVPRNLGDAGRQARPRSGRPRKTVKALRMNM